MSAEATPVGPPDEVYVKQRFIKPEVVAWVKECDRIMLAHGLVVGARTYATKHRARYPARNLKRLMVELRIHEPWQLREHVDRAAGGWAWSVEYLGRSS